MRASALIVGETYSYRHTQRERAVQVRVTAPPIGRKVAVQVLAVPINGVLPWRLGKLQVADATVLDTRYVESWDEYLIAGAALDVAEALEATRRAERVADEAHAEVEDPDRPLPELYENRFSDSALSPSQENAHWQRRQMPDEQVAALPWGVRRDLAAAMAVRHQQREADGSVAHVLQRAAGIYPRNQVTGRRRMWSSVRPEILLQVDADFMLAVRDHLEASGGSQPLPFTPVRMTTPFGPTVML